VKRFLAVLIVLAVGVPATPAVAARAPASAGAERALAVGSRGRAVKALQRRLGVPADGIFGRRTERAVRRFQRRSGLRVTGRVDAATRRALDRPPSTGGAVFPDEAVDIVEAARAALGRPYRAGAAGPDAFDCSGLVVWAARAAGQALPRSSFAQYELGTAVDRTSILRGDLIFFDTNGPGASDVAIATGPTGAISATTHGVREHEIFGPYWGEHYVGARRLG